MRASPPLWCPPSFSCPAPLSSTRDSTLRSTSSITAARCLLAPRTPPPHPGRRQLSQVFFLRARPGALVGVGRRGLPEQLSVGALDVSETQAVTGKWALRLCEPATLVGCSAQDVGLLVPELCEHVEVTRQAAPDLCSLVEVLGLDAQGRYEQAKTMGEPSPGLCEVPEVTGRLPHDVCEEGKDLRETDPDVSDPAEVLCKRAQDLSTGPRGHGRAGSGPLLGRRGTTLASSRPEGAPHVLPPAEEVVGGFRRALYRE